MHVEDAFARERRRERPRRWQTERITALRTLTEWDAALRMRHTAMPGMSRSLGLATLANGRLAYAEAPVSGVVPGMPAPQHHGGAVPKYLQIGYKKQGWDGDVRPIVEGAPNEDGNQNQPGLESQSQNEVQGMITDVTPTTVHVPTETEPGSHNPVRPPLPQELETGTMLQEMQALDAGGGVFVTFPQPPQTAGPCSRVTVKMPCCGSQCAQLEFEEPAMVEFESFGWWCRMCGRWWPIPSPDESGQLRTRIPCLAMAESLAGLDSCGRDSGAFRGPKQTGGLS